MAQSDTHIFPRRLVQTVALLATLICARPAFADTLTVMWDPNVEPDVTGYLVYIGTQPGSYLQAVDVQNANTYVFSSAVPGQRYYFAVAAYAGSLVSLLSSEVSGIANQYPSLLSPGNQSTRVGQAISLQLNGSDPEGRAVSYSVTGLPAGLTASQASGLIAGVPTTAGTYSVTARVSDGVLTSQLLFTWAISNVDGTVPPIVPGGGVDGTISQGGSDGATTDRALVRRASSASTYTGTFATLRPAGTPDATRTIVRVPNMVGQSTGSAASAASGNYTGSSAVTRSVALDQPNGTYTGSTAVPRPVGEGTTGVASSGSTTHSMVHHPMPTGDQPSEADASEPTVDDLSGPALTTAAVRRTPVSAPSSAPSVSIETPVDHATFAAGASVIFSAIARDVEDGDLTAQIVWTSSVDGRIGTGALFNRVLSPGSHTVTASVTDSKGNTRSAQVTVVVQ